MAKHLHVGTQVSVHEVERLVTRFVEQLALGDLVIGAAQQLEHRRHRVPHHDGSHRLSSVAGAVGHRVGQRVLPVSLRVHETDHGDFRGEIAVEPVQRRGAGIDERVAGLHRQFRPARQDNHRAGGVPHDDAARHGVGPVPAAVAGRVGDDVFAQPIRIDRVVDIQPRGDVADRRVVHRRADVNVLGSGLDLHRALTNEPDRGGGGVLNLHHANGRLRHVAAQVLRGVGHLVLPRLGQVHAALDQHARRDIAVEAVLRRGPRLRVRLAKLKLDRGRAQQGHHRWRAVLYRHRPHHLDGGVAA